MLLKHSDYIVSSLGVVGSGLNEPVYCGLNVYCWLNGPLAKLVRFYCKTICNCSDVGKRNVSYIAAGFEASVSQAL